MKRSGPLSARSIKSPSRSEQKQKEEDDLEAMFAMAERVKHSIVRPAFPSHESSSTDSPQGPAKDLEEDDSGSFEDSSDEDVHESQDQDTKVAQDHVRCQFKRTAEKGIRTDLSKLGIAPDVIELADQYYYEVTKGEIKRSNLRKGIMFACVFQAYKDLNRHQTPDYLQNLFKITRRVMSKGLTYFYPRSQKRSGDNGYITPEHFIPRVMETFHVNDEHVQAALQLYQQIKDKTTLFNSSNPQSVSCGLVYYYFKKINFPIPGGAFGKAVGLSEITVTRIASRIDEILNA